MRRHCDVFLSLYIAADLIINVESTNNEGDAMHCSQIVILFVFFAIMKAYVINT